MKTTITRILAFGRFFNVYLSCGCTRRGLTRQDVASEQLYVGKTVACDQHPVAPVPTPSRA